MITDLDIQEVIRQVAEQYGQTPAQVRHNINVALAESRASTDDRHVEAWALVPHEGDEPTLEDVIRYVAEQIATQQNENP